MPTVQDQNLSPEQLITLTRAMLSVAVLDGIHPAEEALIRRFYDAARTADMPAADALIAEAGQAAAPDTSTSSASDAAFADTLVLMCLMCGYADGKLSEAELNLVRTLAAGVGVGDAAFEAHLAEVRDTLTGALSHLPDAGSVAAVVGKL